jgi:asparagine synthase (glutamine-hydrolysing)
MSAIAAVWHIDGRPADANKLTAMSDALKHRGDDDRGIVTDGSVGLLNRMRYTTPESLYERLPMQAADGVHILTRDARIDNRSELITQLFHDESDGGTITDGRIILEAYRRWGKECAERLIGDFVFAIWDKQKQELFAARDPLGVKHFYYYFAKERFFALASEIKALFTLAEIKRELNEEQLAHYLLANSEDKESTFFKGINRLPSTNFLCVSQKGLEIRQYWKPSPNELTLKDDREYQDAFREKLIGAVRSRLRSAYPVGAFLSGGLDSSAIACIASASLRENGNPPLETFSAIFPTVAKTDARIDERMYMRSVINKTGCNAHFVTVDDDNPLREMRKICWHADHPVGAPNVYMDWEIYRATREAGVRVLLSGSDGDSTVGHGYEDFFEFADRGNYLRLFREAVALNKNMPRRSHSLKRSIWNRGIKPALPLTVVKLWRMARRREPSDHTIWSASFPLHFRSLRPEIRRSFDVETRMSKLQERNYPSGESRPQSHWRGLTGGHYSFMLEQLEKASAAFGIEVRYPFFDRGLIEFCISLPPGQRIYRGWTRSIFRHAMEGILPRSVQWRTDKSNIGAGIKMNLLAYGKHEIEEALEFNSMVLEKYVDLDLLKKAYQDYKDDPLSRDQEALLILSNVYLSNWLRQAGFA